MVRRELQGREHHVFNVLPLPSIVLKCVGTGEFLRGEENKVFWVDVSLVADLLSSRGLVELCLEVGACIKRGVMLGVW